MWETIIVACLPLITKLGMWFIESFISDAAAKKKQQEAFLKWVESHKNDGKTSATQHSDYQSQLDELEKKNEPPTNP